MKKQKHVWRKQQLTSRSRFPWKPTPWLPFPPSCASSCQSGSGRGEEEGWSPKFAFHALALSFPPQQGLLASHDLRGRGKLHCAALRMEICGVRVMSVELIPQVNVASCRSSVGVIPRCTTYSGLYGSVWVSLSLKSVWTPRERLAGSCSLVVVIKSSLQWF